ncbi:MAG: LamG domain-containing protein, partial [archaeon]
NVTAYDSIGRQDFRATTNSSGLISPTGITDYVNTGSASGINRTYSSNYVITATNGTRYGRNDSYNVSLYLNKLDNVITLDTIVPTVSILSPLNISNFNTTSILFNVTSSETAAGTGMIVPNLDNSLVSWFRMDDLNSSGGVVDYTGRNNGTAVGNAAQTDNGKFGKAFAFNGGGDYIDIPNTILGAQSTTGVTYSAWVNTLSTSATQAIVGGAPSNSYSYYASGGIFLSSGKPEMILYNGAAYVDTINTSLTLAANQWYHIVGTFNPSSNTSSLYVNGLLQNQSVNIGMPTNSMAESYIGYNSKSTSRYPFNGSIDEVAIWNKSLTADEILALYNATRISHTENLSQGAHSYNAYAQDLAANVVNSGTNTFSVDTIFPQVAFDSSSTNGTINYTSAFMNLTTSDGGKDHFAFVNDGSLLSWWRMDDLNSTGGVVDYFGRNNGTKSGNAAQTDAGKFGKAFAFGGGSSDGVSLGDINSFDFRNSTSFSISSWVKPSNLSGYKRVITNGHWGYTTGWFLKASPVPETGIASGLQATSIQLSANSALTLNVWSHLLVVFDQSNKLASIYVNGIQVPISKYGGTCGTVVGNSLDFSACTDINSTHSAITTIGRYTSGEYFNGSIDEVMIWNRSLSSTEIAALYNATANQYKNNFTGLINGRTYNYTGYAVDLAGNVNVTGVRNVTINANNAPMIALLAPVNGNLSTNRTPTFVYNGTDSEGDSLVYDINRTCIGGCSIDNRLIQNRAGLNYTPTTDFAYLYDNNYYYSWSVRACENATAELYCSTWATPWIVNISAVVSINVTNNFINFGDMLNEESKNTTNGVLNPLRLRNDGNSRVNISMNATQLWDSVVGASNNFMAKIRAYVGNASWANTSWFQLPPITGSVVVVGDLNYTDSSDGLDTDVLLTVPTNEPPGTKTSTINFRASLSEV